MGRNDIGKIVASLPLTDIHLYTQQERSKSKSFINHWKCTIFSQLPSDFLFHISSFPPYDELYCVAVVKFQLYSFSETSGKVILRA